MIEDAISKEAIIDYVWHKYEVVKDQFERENDVKIEWEEIRIKRDGRTVRGLVEFRKVEQAVETRQ